LKFINEFGKYVAFAGFREVRISDVDFFIKEVRSKLDSRVVYQFFNANFVATWKHLFFAVLNALKAFESGSNISRSLAIEILLYASAQRQIQKAMDLIGITPKTTEIAVLVMGETTEQVESAFSLISNLIPGKRDDEVLSLSHEKIKALCEAFRISQNEISAISNNNLEDAIVHLIIERMALLAVQH